MPRWARERVQRKADELRQQLIARRLATEDELPERPSTRAAKDDWWWYLSQIAVYHGRDDPEAASVQRAEAAILAAQLDEPVAVGLLLQTGDNPAEPRSVYVWPKCAWALFWFEAREEALQWLTVEIELRREAVREHNYEELAQLGIDDDTGVFEAIDKLYAELALQLRSVVHAACQPGLDVDAAAAEACSDELGQKIRTMDPMDLMRVWMAWSEVNARRVRDMQITMGREGGGARLPWSVFFSKVASRYRKKVSEVLRDWSLASLLAQVAQSGTTDADAEDEIEG